jgi:outer membrane biosynthesis protein TonB
VHPGRRRRRELGSLGLSLAIHAAALLGASVAWVASRPPPAPEPVQLALVELPPPPAPVAGQPEPGSPRPGRAAERASPGAAPEPEQPAATAEQRRPPRRARPAAPRGPSVEARVRIRRQRPPAAGRPAPAPALVARWSPAAERAVDAARARDAQPPAAAAPVRSAAAERPAGSDSAARAPDPPPAALPFHRHHHGAAGPQRAPAIEPPAERGGSRRERIAIIQARIDRVTPLVHCTDRDRKCRQRSGLARIRFLLDRRGYPRGYQVLDSAGAPCLDRQIDTVLHLAEPYPYVAGWIPVRVRFSL